MSAEKTKAVAVYLGSSEGNSPIFKQTVQSFGRSMAEAGIEVVYGGAAVGTMGILADSVLEAGGRITGVFPTGFGGKREVQAMNVEILKEGLTQTVFVRDFAERKDTMEKLSDCAVVLPGSYGTMDELFTFAVGNEIGLHDKVCYVLNVFGYYDGLEQQVATTKRNGFLNESADMVQFCHSIDELVSKIKQL